MINLKDFGLKSTKSRQHILDILENTKTPLTAEDIYKEVIDDGLNLSTVYRTLTSFVDQSIVYKEIDKNGKAVYMIIKGEHKHVLICVKCGKHIYLNDCPYKEVNEKIFNDTGFEVENHNIEIYGLCKNCQKKGILEI